MKRRLAAIVDSLADVLDSMFRLPPACDDYAELLADVEEADELPAYGPRGVWGPLPVPDPEPPLSDTELIAVRALIEERFGVTAITAGADERITQRLRPEK